MPIPAERAETASAAVELLGVRDLIRVSRLGLMASHLWLFLLPVAVAGRAPSASFWIGALYVTVPLGMLIYGWNDYFDGDVDALSRRKHSKVAKFFGYRLKPSKRRLLPAYIAALNLPFLGLAAALGELWIFGWAAVMVGLNWLYNGPGLRLSRIPVLAELIATCIYLAILWLSVKLTGLVPPWPAWVLAAAAILVFQIGGAIVDIPADRRVGKRTFAATVGEGWASAALAAVVTVKAAVYLTVFDSPAATLLNLLALPLCWLRPAIGNGHWAGILYVYFVIVDWGCLVLLAR